MPRSPRNTWKIYLINFKKDEKTVLSKLSGHVFLSFLINFGYYLLATKVEILLLASIIFDII